VPKRPRDVKDVRSDKNRRRDDLERLRCAQPNTERDDEAADEEREVALERRGVDTER
jgi:hypothetical protein